MSRGNPKTKHLILWVEPEIMQRFDDIASGLSLSKAALLREMLMAGYDAKAKHFNDAETLGRARRLAKGGAA